MPRDLFTLDSVPPARRTRRSSLLLVSVTAHVIAVAGVLLASILLPDVLPHPRAASLEWDPTARMVKLDDIPLPPPPPRQPAAPSEPTHESAVPIEAPHGVTREEAHVPPPPGPIEGLVQGTDFGDALSAPPPPPPPTPEPVKASGPLRVSGGVQAPRKMLDVAPIYPELARAAGAQGLVIIEATIDTTGSVIATKVLRSAPLLDAAAIDAVRQWKYEPARLNGEPVAVLITVTVNFVLGR